MNFFPTSRQLSAALVVFSAEGIDDISRDKSGPSLANGLLNCSPKTLLIPGIICKITKKPKPEFVQPISTFSSLFILQSISR